MNIPDESNLIAPNIQWINPTKGSIYIFLFAIILGPVYVVIECIPILFVDVVVITFIFYQAFKKIIIKKNCTSTAVLIFLTIISVCLIHISFEYTHYLKYRLYASEVSKELSVKTGTDEMLELSNLPTSFISYVPYRLNNMSVSIVQLDLKSAAKAVFGQNPMQEGDASCYMILYGMGVLFMLVILMLYSIATTKTARRTGVPLTIINLIIYCWKNDKDVVSILANYGWIEESDINRAFHAAILELERTVKKLKHAS